MTSEAKLVRVEFGFPIFFLSLHILREDPAPLNTTGYILHSWTRSSSVGTHGGLTGKSLH